MQLATMLVTVVSKDDVPAEGLCTDIAAMIDTTRSFGPHGPFSAWIVRVDTTDVDAEEFDYYREPGE